MWDGDVAFIGVSQGMFSIEQRLRLSLPPFFLFLRAPCPGVDLFSPGNPDSFLLSRTVCH